MSDVDQRPAEVEAEGEAQPNPEKKSSLPLILGVVALGTVVIGISLAAIKEMGITTPMSRVLTVGAAVLATTLALLVANRVLIKDLPGWVYLLAALLVGGAVVAAIVLAEPGWRFDGDLTAEDRSETHPFTVDPGSRTVLSLDVSDGLDANLFLRRGSVRVAGVREDDGQVRIDQTLVGGEWEAEVRAIGKSAGHYDLRIVSDAARSVAVGDSIDSESLVEPHDSNGYSFELDQRQKVLLSVDPDTPPDLGLEIKILKGNGFLAANLPQVNDHWELFVPLDRGPYVVVVTAREGGMGSYTFALGSEAPTGVPTATTVALSDTVDVPDVVGRPEAEAEELLLAAGLAPRSIPVCSSSVGPGVVRQVVKAGRQEDTVVVDHAGVVADQRQQSAGTNVIVKVGTGQSCDG